MRSSGLERVFGVTSQWKSIEGKPALFLELSFFCFLSSEPEGITFRKAVGFSSLGQILGAFQGPWAVVKGLLSPATHRALGRGWPWSPGRGWFSRCLLLKCAQKNFPPLHFVSKENLLNIKS